MSSQGVEYKLELLTRSKDIQRIAEGLQAFKPTAGQYDLKPEFRAFLYEWEIDAVSNELFAVSAQFPDALFLLEYRNPFTNFSGKVVIKRGETIQELVDDYQHASGLVWLFDIFTPFRTEHDHQLPAGSLWQKWIDDMGTAVRMLKAEANGQTAKVHRESQILAVRHAMFWNEQFKKMKMTPPREIRLVLDRVSRKRKFSGIAAKLNLLARLIRKCSTSWRTVLGRDRGRALSA